MIETLVITGVDGFVGRHLARIGNESGLRIIGISRDASPAPALEPFLAGYYSADLRDAWPLIVPDKAAIVHLAGLAAVGPSFDDPQAYITGNSSMVTWMGEALLTQGRTDVRVVGVSTGAVYGNTGVEGLRSEESEVDFASPYVVSKILVENQLAYYRRRRLDVVVARPFNHVGPGQGPGFLVPDLLRQLRQTSPRAEMEVGNLTTRRDYTDVRDVARAYLSLASAESLTHDLYNVASGMARSGEEVLDALCDATQIERPKLRVDRARIRATDPALIVGDASRLRTDTGWNPQITFSQTVKDAVAAQIA